MAKKGQKFKKYTAEIKREVLEKYFSGKSTAKMLGEENTTRYAGGLLLNFVTKTYDKIYL